MTRQSQMEAASKIVWRRVNDEPFEYAIQQGKHGDEFIKLLDGSCLRRAAEADRGVCEPVAVKPLEWSWEPPYSVARVLDRHYSVERWDNGCVDLSGSLIKTRKQFDTVEAAKAAAQADYEQRILSALVAIPPASDPAPQGQDPSTEAMKVAVELEILRCIGSVTTQAIGRLVDQYFSLRTRAPDATDAVAWAILASNGNCRLWWADRNAAESYSTSHDIPLTPLYAAPPAKPVSVETITRAMEAIAASGQAPPTWSEFAERIHTLIYGGDKSDLAREEGGK